MKCEVLPHFAFTRSVFSLTEEVEDSTGTVDSIAIFTAWPCSLPLCTCACLGAHSVLCAGRVYLSIRSIYLLHITVRSFLLIYHIIDINRLYGKFSNSYSTVVEIYGSKPTEPEGWEEGKYY